MIIALISIATFIISIIIFMQQPKFGKAPSGERLQRIKRSPNYKKDHFENVSYTPQLTEGANYFKIIKLFFFGKNPNAIPKQALPSEKVNLKQLNANEECLVWFGHSSYFMQIKGKKILDDPVLSGVASLISFTTKSFKGSDVYNTDDFPDIDYLFITHDHWDHLDHETILKLKPKIKKIITSLGVGALLEHWGITNFIETDW